MGEFDFGDEKMVFNKVLRYVGGGISHRGVLGIQQGPVGIRTVWSSQQADDL